MTLPLILSQQRIAYHPRRIRRQLGRRHAVIPSSRSIPLSLMVCMEVVMKAFDVIVVEPVRGLCRSEPVIPGEPERGQYSSLRSARG